MLLDNRNIIPIEETIKTFNNMTENRVMMERMFLKVGRIPLESKLLSWACSTGRRNEEPSGCKKTFRWKQKSPSGDDDSFW